VSLYADPKALAAATSRGAAEAGGLLILTDFDGTLTPIVRSPTSGTGSACPG
jgi:trehalose-6-phosphatase